MSACSRCRPYAHATRVAVISVTHRSGEASAEDGEGEQEDESDGEEQPAEEAAGDVLADSPLQPGADERTGDRAGNRPDAVATPTWTSPRLPPPERMNAVDM